MVNIVFIQSEKENINNNSIESLVAIQKFSKQTNDEVYAVTFNKDVANKLKNYNLNKIVYVDNPELEDYIYHF
jgi:electron transfer flavoprotein alpha subunit